MKFLDILELQAEFQLMTLVCGWGAGALHRAIKVICDVENQVQKRQSLLEEFSGTYILCNIESQKVKKLSHLYIINLTSHSVGAGNPFPGGKGARA
jgi:hypothetical protein